MFRRTIAVAARSSYSVFLQKTKKHPALKGLSVVQRGKAVAKLYKALPKKELAALKAEAAKKPQFKKKVKKTVKRKPTAFSLYVKNNIKKTRGKTMADRLKTLAKKWKAGARK